MDIVTRENGMIIFGLGCVLASVVANCLWRRFVTAVVVSAAASTIVFLAIDIAFRGGSTDIGVLPALPVMFTFGAIVGVVIGVPFLLFRRFTKRERNAAT